MLTSCIPFSLCSWFHNWDTITEPQEPILPVVSVCQKVSEANFLPMQQLKIIIAPAHNNPLRKAFFGGGGFKRTASHSEAEKKKKIARFVAKKKQTWKENNKESICSFSRLRPQSRVLISYCFRPKQRQRSRRSKQMTIKLSNKHHPAMIPNADCGRARRESDSGGSGIVSSHFDAELKMLAEKEIIKP